MKTLQITMTATCRPDILKQTLESFGKYCFREYPCNLIANIDPVGHGSVGETAMVIRNHFPNALINTPETPSLINGFKWCWDEFDADYLFNLEDDWELLRECPIEDMIAKMESIPKLASLRLSLWDSQDSSVRAVYSSMAEHNSIPWNAEDGFCEVPDWNKPRLATSGHPSLYNGAWVRQIRYILGAGLNPEKVLRIHPVAKQIQKQWRFGIWIKPNEQAMIRDIGKTYKHDHHYKKAGGVMSGNKEWFSYWEKDND